MIWLIGAKGMLGREVSAKLAAESMDFVATDVEVSILDPAALETFASDKQIDWVINCAAYTAVDRAEDEEDLATTINGQGPENIARLCQSIGARLIHISTDYVFRGNKDLPLTEEEPVGPIGAYGRSKLKGEEVITGLLPEHFIIRTAWLYGNTGPSFVHTMLRLMSERDEISVVNDQIGSPTWTGDLADTILTFIKQDCKEYGIYHYSNTGRISWYDFACGIYKESLELGLIESECRINAVDSSAYPTKATRPAFSLLSKDKVTHVLGKPVPDWRDSLRTFLLELKG